MLNVPISAWSQALLTVGTTKIGPDAVAPPGTVTTTDPVVAPVGTVATMLVFVQLEILVPRPLKVTPPITLPKFTPVMVTLAPALPVLGLRPLTEGPTTNFTPLLCSEPAVVTVTFPVVAELGTLATILVSDQLEMEAVWPLKLTDPVLLPK